MTTQELTIRASKSVGLLLRVALVLFVSRAWWSGEPAAQQPQTSFAIRNARVFDGERLLPRATVIVENGTIAAVGADIAIPEGLSVVDGTGRTLLPGLIDAHTHTRDAEQLVSALAFGVTTQLDMNTSPAFAAAMRREQAHGRANARADLLSAGTGVTTPGGHGSAEPGGPPPMLSTPEEADGFVRARLAEGSDYIKIIIDDGRIWARPRPTLSPATVAAVIASVHEHGKRAIAHTVTLDDARAAVAAGIDGFVHVWVDREPDEAFLAEMRRRRIFVTPTLAVFKTRVDNYPAVELLQDARLGRFASAAQVQQLKATNPLNAERTTPARYEHAAASVAAMSRAGIRILAGADAPNAGTTYGVSIHHELQLLVDAGLTPQQALTAATSAPAEAFGLQDRGRIERGRRADLLLVDGDPLADITHTRSITAVWKAGHLFARDAYAAAVDEHRKALASGTFALGLVSNFDGGTPATRAGGAWLSTTDAQAGGTSSAALDVVPGGPNGSTHALQITAHVAAGVTMPWAGAIVFPAGVRPLPVNLSAAAGFRFAARGDAGTYRVTVGTARSGRSSAVRTFTVGPDWQTYAFRWSDFDDVDGTDVVRITIVAGPQPGRYVLQLDDFEIR